MRLFQIILRVAISTALLLPGARLTAQKAPTYWGDLRPGPYEVGYRLDHVADASRTAAIPAAVDSLARPGLNREVEQERVLPLRIWYPAARASGRARMNYGAYLETTAKNGLSPTMADGLRARTIGLVRFAAAWYAAPTGAGRAAVPTADTIRLVERLLATPAYAVRAARPAPGSFPVIVFAGGAFHSEDENVVLWEYLASHGYVVAFFPSVGVGQTSLPATPSGLEVQARDVETVIGHLKTVPFADRTRLAAMGFSFGGAAALVAAARNQWIDAVIGLDASFMARQYVPMIRAAPLFGPARVRVPFLEFHRADSTVTFDLVDSLRSSVRHDVEFVGLDHIDFGSYALIYRAMLADRLISPSSTRDSVLSAKAAAYVGTSLIIREFLDAHLKELPGAGARLNELLQPGAQVWSRLPAGAIRIKSR